MLTAFFCIAMTALLLFSLSGCAVVGTKRTAQLNERLMAMFTQLDEAKDAAVLEGAATDDYILQYYDIRQQLVNLSPYLPEGGVEMDKDTYKELFTQVETIEAEIEAFVTK